MIPNTIVEQLRLMSHKRLPLNSGNKRSCIDMSVEVPYINAYHRPKIRNIEPARIRNIPAIAIDLTFIIHSLLIT